MPKSYLIGTTNKFIKSLNKLEADVIIDIDTEQIVIEKEENKKLLKYLFDILGFQFKAF